MIGRLGPAGRSGIVALVRHEDDVCTARLLQLLLKPLQRHVSVARQALCGLQAEAAEPFGRNDPTDGQPLRADGVLFPAQRTFGGNRIRARQAEQHSMARSYPKLLGQRLVEHDFMRPRQ